MLTAAPLAQRQIDALNSLLDFVEADEDMTDVRWIAYALATVEHETYNPKTRQKYEPIEERGKGLGHPYGIRDPGTGQVYYGRGFVQLTWKKNYQLFARKLNIDLLNYPELAMEPETAYQILSLGMREGLFTGKKLGDYIDETTDYLHARRIINGMDKATLIAGYAERFEAILTAAIDSTIEEPAEPAPPAPIEPTETSSTTTTTVEQPPAPPVTTTVTTSGQVRQIASTGLTTIGNRLASGGISGGVIASIGAFTAKAWPVLIFAAVLIVLGFVTWWLIYQNQHKEKQIEAQIASDPARTDIHFAEKK